MGAEPLQDDTEIRRQVTKPRPGHADLNGALKYNHRDMRNILERSSARETAARVAAGSVAKQLLREIGIEVLGFVKQIYQVKANDQPKLTMQENKKFLINQHCMSLILQLKKI